jgi:small membrane protein
MLLQLLAIVFCLFALWRVIAKFRRQELKPSEFAMWFIFWLAVGVAFVTPASLTYLANLLGIGRGADLVLYVAVVVVFYLMFRIFVRLEKMEHEITKVVRASSLSRAERSGVEGSREDKH